MNPDEEFPIILVTQDHYELAHNEVIGTNSKFWFEHKKLGYCLYKQNKCQNIGQDWSEKVASELCDLLKLPHAIYYLAETWDGNRGIVSPSFLPKGATLIHGNEILTRILPNYPTFEKYGVSQHTIDIVLSVLTEENINFPIDWNVPKNIQNPVEVFVGYLMLDAWIGNGDRHHLNWGLINSQLTPHTRETIHLAPTYDHASSLGRELYDEKRQKLTIDSYIKKCKSAFYESAEDKKSLKTFDVFYQVAIRYPQAAIMWLEHLERISPADTLLIVNRIPKNRISSITIEFAQKILELNQDRLLNLKELLT